MANNRTGKTQERLKLRQAGHDASVATSKTGGREFKRPGSENPKKTLSLKK